MKDKLLSMLGLCKKAGRLVQGFDPVAQAAAQDGIFLIVLAEDLSPKSAKEIRHVALKQNIEVCAAPFSMDEVWHRTGRRAGILAISDQGLAEAVKRILSRVTEEDLVV